ncbi:ROK family transcriptional regulator [Subtercola vilae]|uniref:ROK family transcriptional regulator n=1 Tax=Subtercola vilae TaxID=2056433 RepID=A0A4T2C082_9MICO|nr:ROK family transcriptional regulator [Subtercola vilae]TIH37099.1 ROK family transcriptional regulator [Subtercola vilae]
MASRVPPSFTRFSAQNLAILGPLRAGLADSKADLAKITGLSPSTVTARVDELIGLGHVIEVGDGVSRGGRRPRRLALRHDGGIVGCIDLGIDRTSIGLVDLSGQLVARIDIELDVAAGPHPVLQRVWAEFETMLAESTAYSQLLLRGLSVGVPGPVSAETGRVIAPSRMPGWNGIDVAQILGALAGVPVLVNNDANLMALGEYAASDRREPDQVFVKAGSGIGCGIIARGELFTGSRGAAGDISHVSVPGAPPVACSCGRTGCLDALASGNALVRELQAAGREVATVEDMIALARDADPVATRLLREAGSMTGGVLATIVNFFNPDRLVLGGVLSQSEVFVTGVRAMLYAECLPLATDRLTIATATRPDDCGLLGAGTVFLDRMFSLQGI